MTAYQKYQLQWMIDHDHSLDEMISEMLAMQTDGDKVVFDGDVADLFSEWEYSSGFGGEIWACLNEWKECEGSMMDAVYEQYVHDKNLPDEEDDCE